MLQKPEHTDLIPGIHSERRKPTPKCCLLPSLVGHDTGTHIHTAHANHYIHTHRVIENKITENLRVRNSHKSKSRGRKRYRQGCTQHLLDPTVQLHDPRRPSQCPLLALRSTRGLCWASKCSRMEHLREIRPDMLGYTFNPRIEGRDMKISEFKANPIYVASSRPRVTE